MPAPLAARALALAFVLLIACGRALAAAEPDAAQSPLLDLTPAERLWIKEHPAVRLGVDPDYPPFEFFDHNGRYQGIASDYLRIIENRTGLKILTPREQAWPITMREARTRMVDLLAAVGKSPERETFLNFSDAYQHYRRVLLMRDNAPPISGLTDLTGQTIGALRDSTDPALIAEAAPDIKLELFDRYDDALLALSAGRVDAIVGNGLSAIYSARQLGIINIKVAAPASFDHYSIYFAARKDWPELISIINKTLATIPATERNEIQRKWALASAPEVKDYSLIWKTALALTPLFLIALIWAYHTKKQQHRLERIRDQLKAATVRAEASSKAKSTFLANMSHEMRTPLTSIIGFLGLILEAKTDDDVRQNAEISLGSAKDLLQLINDILDLARLESGVTRASQSPMSVPGLIGSVIAAMRPLAEEKALMLDFKTNGMGPALVYQDSKLLRQILVNLLGNAIKFTNTGRVQVILNYLPSTRPGFCHYQIDVVDTGIGIREEHLEKLTRRFEQVHSLAVNNSSGAGLGLAICKELSQLLGGEFFFTSEFGKGSVFSVKLNSAFAAGEPEREAEEKAAIATETEQRASISGAAIYVADDNAIIRKLVEKILQQHGARVTLFENGVYLYEALRAEADQYAHPRCDLILMDIHMPDMDGLETQRRIRRLGDPFKQLPVIALTANAIRGEREIYLAEGMDGYISKPIETDSFLATLRSFLTIRPTDRNPH